MTTPSSPFAAICPPEITRARTLLFVSAGLGVLGSLVGLGAVAGDRAGLSIVLGLVGIALQIGLAVALGNGRNWARIVLTVFIVISLVFFLIGLVAFPILLAAGALGVTIALVSVVQTALSVTVLVLMWREASTRYLTADRTVGGHR